MASGYALPSSARTGARHGHSYTHSQSHIDDLQSTRHTSSNGFLQANGSLARKAASTSNLYTHTEASRETSPMASPGQERQGYLAAQQGNIAAFEANQTPHPHTFSALRSGRYRGESDLGRPTDATRLGYRSEVAGGARNSSVTIPAVGIDRGILIPLPYMLASAVFSAMYETSSDPPFPPLATYARLQPGFEGQMQPPPGSYSNAGYGLLESGIFAGGTLLILGLLQKVLRHARSHRQPLDRRKDETSNTHNSTSVFDSAVTRLVLLRTLTVGLPIYASMQIGGMRVGLILLLSFAAGLTGTNLPLMASFHEWKHILSSRVATVAIICLCAVADLAGVTLHAHFMGKILGYAALFCSFLATAASSTSTSRQHKWNSGRGATSDFGLFTSDADVNLTMVAGGSLFVVFELAKNFLLPPPSSVIIASILLAVGVLSGTLSTAITFRPVVAATASNRVAGLAAGCFVLACSAFAFSPSLWPGTVCNGGFAALGLLAVLYDTHDKHLSRLNDLHEDVHAVHAHHHHAQQYSSEKYSTLTRFVLERVRPGSLVHGILIEKDSRRIAYFTILNFAFMFVQGVYGYLSGSLGLLSDTVHMFFDCLGLIVGLGAAVASKWPTSPEKPFGWGKLNTLAGFGNGVFLMLVSVEFVWEAIEGIVEGRKLRHVEELLVVSTLGLLVNLVGLFAFGHAHAGHGHSHPHSSDHDHSHPNGHVHSHDGLHDHSASKRHTHTHAGHGHEHHNENMHGIFLHVAADAGGSLAVIISTALTLWQPWYLWDPLATIAIAILIFAAAVPLVTSSGQKLLLVVPADLEYSIKNTLQELSELRGVLSYTVPRFWVADNDVGSDAHASGHEHENEHHLHHHGHSRTHSLGMNPPSGPKIQGVIHVIAPQMSDLEDVRTRVQEFTKERGMDLVVQVEREGEACWCGGAGLKA